MADLRTLALCAGVAGLELGVRAATGGRARVVAYCERDPFAASVLLARMEEQALEPAPVWCGDLADMPLEPLAGSVDLVCSGFPCQPWSTAGKRRGKSDERWIWPDIARVIREVGPRLVFLENVRGLLAGNGIGAVLGSLADLRFDAEWCCVRASDVGAPHQRERVFILGHARESRLERRIKHSTIPTGGSASLAYRDGGGQSLERDVRIRRAGILDADGRGGEGHDILGPERVPDAERDAVRPEQERREPRRPGEAELGYLGSWPPGPNDTDGWRRVLRGRPDLAPALEEPEPPLRRVADELPHRLDRAMADRTDRLRALGNAVVPAQAAAAWRELASRFDMTHHQRPEGCEGGEQGW